MTMRGHAARCKGMWFTNNTCATPHPPPAAKEETEGVAEDG